MQPVNQLNSHKIISDVTPGALNVGTIPALKHEEAPLLAQVELERFISLTESLQTEELELPTACTLWNVREIVAHQADHCHYGIGGFSGFVRYVLAMDMRPYQKKGMNQLDSMNQVGIDQRADRTQAQLIAEMREYGPHAIQGRDKSSWIPRNLIWMPYPVAGWTPFIGYLFDVILTRDMWMHRLDICRATGREMILSEAHDGKIIALLMRDLGRYLRPRLGNKSVVFDLMGTVGGRWQVGDNPNPDAIIHMDVLDFSILMSARLTAQQIFDKNLVSFEGSADFVRHVLENSLVLF